MYIPPEQLVDDYAVLSVETGPRAFGLSQNRDEAELYAVYAAPTATFWGFDKPPTHVDDPAAGRYSWEIERFLQLALAGDPAVIECLWSPIVVRRNDIGDGLLTLRPNLLSKQVFRTFTRGANAAVDRLSTHRGDLDWRRVMHMLRLLISVGHLLRTGEPLLRVDAYRDRLLAVRDGEYDWDEVRRWREKLSVDAQEALSASPLPSRPDRELADRFLIEVRRRMV